MDGVIEIVAAEFKFSPARIALGLGQQARVQITSEDETYSFTIDELGVDEELLAGQMVVVDLRANQEGEFTFYSAVRRVAFFSISR